MTSKLQNFLSRHIASLPIEQPLFVKNVLNLCQITSGSVRKSNSQYTARSIVVFAILEVPCNQAPITKCRAGLLPSWWELRPDPISGHRGPASTFKPFQPLEAEFGKAPLAHLRSLEKSNSQSCTGLCFHTAHSRAIHASEKTVFFRQLLIIFV